MSEQNNQQQPIIVIKKIVKKSAHHGGSWKIAYADFVTAMMAFFLLMWLLSMLNKYQLMGISNYFSKPMKNIFVDNQKNDIKEEKIPDEQTKKYKLVLDDEQKQPINAKSINQDHDKTPSDANKKNQAELQFAQMKKQLQNELLKDKDLKKYAEQLNFDIVKDGLKISLHDLENKPMFSLGQTDFESYAGPILKWLSAKINQSHKKLTIIGHTDTKQYAPDINYSNWELSSDRANTTRRILIKYGMSSNNVLRIQGAADSVLLDKKSGESPKNRRIEIILLSDEAVQRLIKNE